MQKDHRGSCEVCEVGGQRELACSRDRSSKTPRSVDLFRVIRRANVRVLLKIAEYTAKSIIFVEKNHDSFEQAAMVIYEFVPPSVIPGIFWRTAESVGGDSCGASRSKPPRTTSDTPVHRINSDNCFQGRSTMDVPTSYDLGCC